jgi:competence protein ComEC
VRLDIDARYIPLAIITWTSCLFISSKNSILLVIIFTTYLIILKILKVNKLIILIHSLIFLAAFIAINSRILNDNLLDQTNFAKAIPIYGTVKISSDLKKSYVSNFGIFQEEQKYEINSTIIRLGQKINGKNTQYELRNKLKLEFEIIEQEPKFGSVIYVEGLLQKQTFGKQEYLLEVSSYSKINDPNILNSVINKVRTNFLIVTRLQSGEAPELLPGLILGDTREQSKYLINDMKVSGLTHLTAVSGGNIAILLLAFLWLFQKFRVKIVYQMFFSLLILLFFAFLVRTEPSVIRASIMGTISILGIFTGTRRHGLTALSIAVCVALLLDPHLALAWGFSLSVFATLGLLLYTSKISTYICKLMPWFPESLSILFSVALAAQISTMSLIAGFTGQLSLWSIPANVCAAPAVAFVTILGYLTLIWSSVNVSIALVFGYFASFFANWIGIVAHYFSQKQVNQIIVPKGFLGFGIASLFILLLHLLYYNFNIIKIFTHSFYFYLMLLLIFGFNFISKTSNSWPIKNWQFVMCDVGQGDGLVIKDSLGHVLVVDVGPNGKIMSDCLKELQVKKIDALILTHFHADHIEGLEIVSKRYEIKEVFLTWVKDPVTGFDRVQEILGDHQTKELKYGNDFSLGEINVKTLWPTDKYMNIESVANNASVVTVVSINNASFLLTGDIEPPAQQAIQQLWQMPRVDVIKIPHHGSKFQDERFPVWSGARLALISVGKDNKYGHPSLQTIDLYQRSGIRVLNTIDVGSIAIRIDQDDSIKVFTSD